MDSEKLALYPLLEALKKRRSRRFGLGMKMDEGPLAYRSLHEPFPALLPNEWVNLSIF